MKSHTKRIAMLLSFYILILPISALSARFEWFYNGVNIKGEIVKGDYERLIEIIKYMDQPPMIYQLDSMGGDVLEAIKIGSLLRETYAKVIVDDMQVCASACVFILVGSPDRLLFDGARIGIHRPFFNRSYFSTLTAAKAEKKYRELQNIVKAYLLNMGVPQDFIDMMYTISSNDVKWISGAEIEEKLGEKTPFYEELLLSKCGRDLTAEEYDIFYNRDNKYSKKLVNEVRRQAGEYNLCEMSLSEKERREFMKKHGLKAQNPHNTERWVGLDVKKAGDKFVITEYSVDD